MVLTWIGIELQAGNWVVLGSGLAITLLSLFVFLKAMLIRVKTTRRTSVVLRRIQKWILFLCTFRSIVNTVLYFFMPLLFFPVRANIALPGLPRVGVVWFETLLFSSCVLWFAKVFFSVPHRKQMWINKHMVLAFVIFEVALLVVLMGAALLFGAFYTTVTEYRVFCLCVSAFCQLTTGIVGLWFIIAVTYRMSEFVIDSHTLRIVKRARLAFIVITILIVFAISATVVLIGVLSNDLYVTFPFEAWLQSDNTKVNYVSIASSIWFIVFYVIPTLMVLYCFETVAGGKGLHLVPVGLASGDSSQTNSTRNSGGFGPLTNLEVDDGDVFADADEDDADGDNEINYYHHQEAQGVPAATATTAAFEQQQQQRQQQQQQRHRIHDGIVGEHRWDSVRKQHAVSPSTPILTSASRAVDFGALNNLTGATFADSSKSPRSNNNNGYYYFNNNTVNHITAAYNSFTECATNVTSIADLEDEDNESDDDDDEDEDGDGAVNVTAASSTLLADTSLREANNNRNTSAAAAAAFFTAPAAPEKFSRALDAILKNKNNNNNSSSSSSSSNNGGAGGGSRSSIGSTGSSSTETLALQPEIN